MNTAPLLPLVVTPVAANNAPDEPDVDAPEYTDTDPDAPLAATPVNNRADPLEPAVEASDVASVMLPELDDTPEPVITVTLPPALDAVVVPAAINKLPPVPVSVAPDSSDSD
jgi:hypothetical protein